MKLIFLVMMALLIISKVAVTGKTLIDALSLSKDSLSNINYYNLYIYISLKPTFCNIFFNEPFVVLDFPSSYKMNNVRFTATSTSA